jgi:hypothetical protein
MFLNKKGEPRIMSEPKKWVEVALMPLVIAVVGIMGTYLVTSEQRETAKIRADADRQIKIIDIFANKIISADVEERLLAARLTMAMDSDLALKIMTVFDLEAEKSTKVREVVKNLTAHAIISKLAEGKRGTAYQEAILEGRWLLRQQITSLDKGPIVNWLEFKAAKAGLTVHGNSWKGEVTFDGKHGYYLWKFENGWTGRTDFYLDSTGILFGKVKGVDEADHIDWTYWAIRGQSTAVGNGKPDS